MAFFGLDPITRKRFARFRRIRAGWYSLLVLMCLMVLSFFSEYLANHRAIAAEDLDADLPGLLYEPWNNGELELSRSNS